MKRAMTGQLPKDDEGRLVFRTAKKCPVCGREPQRTVSTDDRVVLYHPQPDCLRHGGAA